jgi:hypothetical protein
MRTGSRDALVAHRAQVMPGEAATGDRDGGRDVRERAQHEGALVHSRMGHDQMRHVDAAASV